MTSPSALAGRIDAARAAPREALRSRLIGLADAFGVSGASGLSTEQLLAELEAGLAPPTAERIWLALAVLDAALPDSGGVQRSLRAARLDGPLAALDRAVFTPALAARREWLAVELVTGAVLVDVHHTSATAFATGIQRVARESARRWHRDHDPVFVGWHPSGPALRRLSADEVRRGLTGEAATSPAPSSRAAARGPVLVPWRATYVLAELRAEPQLAAPLQALLRYSGNRGAALAFDCVPITTAETVVDGMSAGFAASLAALVFAERIAPISRGAATEYTGWRTMLAGAGRSGPKIAAIPLPVERVEVSADALERARRRFTIAGLPMVLAVGSHEPRKNHLAVLHAAELLWRDGAEFSLVFIGGHAWKSESFDYQLAALQERNRPVHVLNAVSEQELWAAYRLARCTVFPSLNEGFGLPVAESLASHTPVVTSNFGSMLEIAEGGGALLVDPRNDHEIADALGRLLREDELHGELSRQARERVPRSWDDYARETWNYLALGVRPS